MRPAVFQAVQAAMLLTLFGIDLERLQREHEERLEFRRKAKTWLMRAASPHRDATPEQGNNGDQ